MQEFIIQKLFRSALFQTYNEIHSVEGDKIWHFCIKVKVFWIYIPCPGPGSWVKITQCDSLSMGH